MARILLIDDDSVLLKLYSTRLTADKHIVDTAANGEEGYEKIRLARPDVIVLDLLMPKVNGFTFLETLNKYPDLQKIPKIIFSSVANQEQIERLKALGIKIFLNKIETTPTQLVGVINQIIGPPGAAQSQT